MCARLGDEQGQCGLGLHAYGVGRGVDKLELLRIISAADPETAEDRCGGGREIGWAAGGGCAVQKLQVER